MRRTLLLALPLALALGVAAALGYYSSTGSGNASASVGGMSAPTISSATAGAGTVALAWSTVSPPPPGGSVTYYVSRNGGAAGGNCPSSASPTSATSCTDSGLAAGTYDYTVTAVWRSWHATSSSSPVTLASGALDHFSLTAATTTPAAGSTDNLTITAKDSAGNTVTAYGGDQTLTFSGAGTIGSNQPTVTSKTGTAVAFGTAETIAFSSGVATVSGPNNGVMTLYKAETATVTVSDGTHTGSVGVTVAPTAAVSYTVSAPGSATAGSAISASLTAKDTYGNTATAYTGSHTVDFSGPHSSPGGTSPSYPAAVTFTSGAGTASVTLYDAETTTLTATDHASPSITGTSGSIVVSANTAASLSLSAASTTPTAGATDNLTITAKDTWLNTATGYTGDKSLTFGGASNAASGTHPTVTSKTGTAVNFGTAETITFTSGVASVSSGSNGVMTLYKVESASITVGDGSISNGSGLSVTVSPGSIASLSLSAASTTPTAGATDNLTITAKDTWLNTVTGYAGSKNLTFSGASSIGANNPTVTNSSGTAIAFGSTTAITFTSGVATVSGSSNGVMTLYKAEATTVTVSNGTQTGNVSVTVSAAAVANIATTSGGGQSATVSTAFSNPLSATVTDTYGNPKSGISVTFGAPASGASSTFASGGNCTSNPHTYQCVASTNASGVATSSTFTANASQGTYNISATASGGSNPSVNFSETNIGLLHISSLVTGTTSGATSWTGSITVTVTDSSGTAVNGVSVTGAWSPTPAASPSGCTTNASGQCTITPAAASFPSAQITETWTASSLSLSGYSYASASNVESAVTLSRGCAAATVCQTNLTSTTAFTDTTAGTSSSTASLSGTNTPPSGSTVLILIARDGSQSGDTVSSVTGSAISNATPVTSNLNNLSTKAGAFTNLWVYRAQGTGATTTPAVTVNFSQSDNRATLVQVIVLSGENTTNPIAQFNNANKCTAGCTTTATATLTNALSTGSKEIVLVGEAKATATAMTSASWATKLFWARLSGTRGANDGSFFGTSAASGTVTLGTASLWGAIALEIARSS